MSSSNFAALIQVVLTAATTGTPQKEAILRICDTPQYLVDHCGFTQLPLIIKAATVDKVHFDHGITKGLLQRLETIVLTPKALYKSDTVPDGAVVVTLEVKNGNPVVIAFHPNKLIGRSTYNVIASIYDKPQNIESRWQANGLLLWTPAAPALPIPLAHPVLHSAALPQAAPPQSAAGS
jgi:Phage MuF-C-terminal domain